MKRREEKNKRRREEDTGDKGQGRVLPEQKRNKDKIGMGFG